MEVKIYCDPIMIKLLYLLDQALLYLLVAAIQAAEMGPSA